MKGFILGFIVCSIIFSSTSLASVIQTIQVSYDDIKIFIEGKETIPDYDMLPFVYNGRTYVSLRFVGEALNKNVYWNSENKFVNILDYPSTNTPTPTPLPTNTPKPTQTPTYTPSPEPVFTSTPTLNIETEEPVVIGQLNLASEIKDYLDKNFSTLETCIGTTHFTFRILENTRSYQAYDYWIMVNYEYDFFGGAMGNISYTTEQKNTLRQQLKDFQEKLAKSIILVAPTKKFLGGYYDSWYRYPSLKVDLQSRRYYSWINYNDTRPSDIMQTYESSKLSEFRWWSLIDDEL